MPAARSDAGCGPLAAPAHGSSTTEALRNWDGPDGDYWVAHEAIFDTRVARYGPAFFDAAAITPDDRVLDIGCGTGQTTRRAAQQVSRGEATGIDLSSAMLVRARQRAADEQLGNAQFVHGDAQIHRFPPATYDLAISRTGAMFFGQPVDAFTNIARALHSNGRLVLLVWQTFEQNHWVRDFTIALAAGRPLPSPAPNTPGPFSLADRDRAVGILTEAGFSQVYFEPAEELMFFGANADEAYRFVRGLGFTNYMLQGLDDATRHAALEQLRTNIDDHATNDGVLYQSAALIITARKG